MSLLRCGFSLGRRLLGFVAESQQILHDRLQQLQMLAADPFLNLQFHGLSALALNLP